MRFAYADPPYLGQARKHYGDDPNAREVNHHLLIGYMDSHFDAWALSLSATSDSLRSILMLCPHDVRVGAWVKPFASFKPGVGNAYAWEPVIFRGGRQRTRTQPTVRDWVAANITLQRGTHGAKPLAFCMWLFEFLNAQPGDEFEDVFPGSGAVGRAWDVWCGRWRAYGAQLNIFEALP